MGRAVTGVHVAIVILIIIIAAVAVGYYATRPAAVPAPTATPTLAAPTPTMTPTLTPKPALTPTAPSTPLGEGGNVVEVYRSPTCGCCGAYEEYLEAEGFKVKPIVVENPEDIKNEFGIERSMWSCHTMKIEGYFVEGHAPVEAIRKLLEERPKIDGIALPGMPLGSPGMPGRKTQPFVIYSISNGDVKVFIRL